MKELDDLKYYNFDRWLLVYIFLFFLVPKANVYIGSAPVYFLDLISIYLILKYRKFYLWRFTRTKNFFIFLISMFFLSQIIFIIIVGESSIVAYNTIRYSIPLFASITFFPKNLLFSQRGKQNIFEYNCFFLFDNFTNNDIEQSTCNKRIYSIVG